MTDDITVDKRVSEDVMDAKNVKRMLKRSDQFALVKMTKKQEFKGTGEKENQEGNNE